MRIRALVLAALAVATVAAPPARAEPPMSPTTIAIARTLNDRGRAAHDAGDYVTAIAAFKEAYILAPSPGVLFNLAQAYRLHGDCADAGLMYRRYLATAPVIDNREAVDEHLATVDRCANTTPSTAYVALFAPRPPAATDPGRAKRHAGIAIVVAGAAFLAASLYFAIDAHLASDDVSHFYMTGGAWTAIAGTDARGRRSADLATGFAVGGGVAVLTGGVFYALGRTDEHAPLPVDVSISAHGARASVSWQF